LREHPEMSGFRDTGAPEDEGQHLQSVMPKAYRHGGPARFGFSNAMHMDESSSLVTTANRRRLFEEWSRYWDVRRVNLLEKSPPNLIRSRFLQAMFPNTSFIFLMRHPIAVTYATKKWKPRMRLSRFIEHWLVCHERMRDDASHLQRSLVLQYEDFVAAPQNTLDRIFAFLDLKPIPLTEDVHRDVNHKYFDMWQHAARGVYGGWRHRRIIRAYESRINAFGYTFRGIEAPDASGRISTESMPS
jgi:hypothetical protein